ncbi:hypothetical protein ALI44B_05830 [Leifsonia sp. ALI-44-B]|jgi:hypothetical protein|uniref:hypothetical protein n=1 Tax=Leifsonia sp. ALI-44-B TaxID=1933776 RepID=UPI00097CB0AF|nr:hypothetical protein [Leifsonia sp. ALI-44-B]ONI64097.1 hypothetical protein ALI44B_05830 [Leifsonia sp. ALI-44-B]
MSSEAKLAHLHNGPLDGQTIPLENGADDELVLPYSEGQLVYRLAETPADEEGPTTAHYHYAETTEVLLQGDDQPRDDAR